MPPRQFDHRRPEAERLIDQLVRAGRVSSVNQAAGTAQVEFAEDGLVSGDLRVVHHGAGDKWMPAPGSQVLCLFLGAGLEVGFVLGTTTSDADPPPTDDDARVIAGDDVRLGSHEASAGVGRVGDTVKVTIPAGTKLGPDPTNGLSITLPSALTISGSIVSGSSAVKAN